MTAGFDWEGALGYGNYSLVYGRIANMPTPDVQARSRSASARILCCLRDACPFIVILDG
jgi:hypothetical protein